MTAPPPDRLTPAALPAGRRRPAAVRVAALVFAALACAGFLALGNWQVERRAWKHDLIARVEARVHAPAAPPPARSQWPQVNAADDEYQHVRIAGTFLHDKEALVQASTRLGAGFWVLTPLATADGVVLVNRGFVPPEARARATRAGSEPQGETSVTGLLRISEPRGGFLRRNDPAADRWFSRDVQAIAAARGLADAAPYFVDAAAAEAAPGAAPAWPAGGLTVVAFPDSHMVYAITWYGLALMVAGAAWFVWRDDRRRSRCPRAAGSENAVHADARAHPGASDAPRD